MDWQIRQMRVMLAKVTWSRTAAEVLPAAVVLFAAALAQSPDIPEFILQSGHAANISALIFSPDGKILASASGDATVRLWDPFSGTQLRRLRGHTDLISAIAFNGDGSELASASLDHTMRVWNTSTGEAVAIWKGPNPATNFLKFTPDGKLLISAETVSTGTILRMWNVKNRQQVRAIKREGAAVSQIFFNLKGTRLMVADETGEGDGGGSLTVFDLATGREIESRKGLIAGASNDGQWIAVDHSNQNGTRAEIIDTAANKKVKTISGQVSQVAFSRNGEWLAYAHAAGDTAVVEKTAAAGSRTIKGHSAEFSMLALSPDGQMLATSGADFSVHIWNTATGQLARGMPGQYTPTQIAFSPDGNLLAANGGSADLGHALQIWDLNRKAPRVGPVINHAVLGVSFSADGAYLAVTDPQVEIFDAKANALVAKLPCVGDATGSPAFSPDGELVAANCRGVITAWRVSSGAEAFHFGEHGGPVSGQITFSPNGKLLASVGGRGIFLYDVAAQRALPPVKTVNPVAALAFSADSQLLAFGTRLVGSSDNKDTPVKKASLMLWDRRTRHVVWETPVGAWVSSVAFARDDKTLLAATGEDLHKAGEVTVFDTAKGLALKRLPIKAPSGAAGFSRDLVWFAAGANSAVSVWRLAGPGAE